MKPTIGRIVHYRSHGSKDGVYEPECRAAIVTGVEYQTAVDLTVFNPEGIFLKQACAYDATNTGGGTWHWPEREADDCLQRAAEGMRSVGEMREALKDNPWGTEHGQ